MTRRSRYVPIFALLGLTAALAPMLGAAQQSAAQHSQPAGIHPSPDVAHQPIAEIPSTVDAPAAANHLIESLRDPSSLTRVQTQEQNDASTAIAPETIIATLQDSLHDSDPLVREAALRALIRRDNEQTPVLNEADVAGFQGESAELAKVHFAERNADSSTLKDLMQHGNAVVQQNAFEALASTDLSSAVEALLAEIRDTKSIYRLQTLELLTRSSYTNSSSQLLPILHELATDSDPLVRDFANQTWKEKQHESATTQAR